MNLNELNELDFGNVGDWPWIVKLLLILLLCGLVVVGWYYLDTQDQLLALEKVEKQERLPMLWMSVRKKSPMVWQLVSKATAIWRMQRRGYVIC